MSSCTQHHGGNRLKRRMNQHCLSPGFLIPALPRTFPTTVPPCPQDEAGGLCSAHRGTEQMPYRNHCTELLEKVLHSHMQAAGLFLTPTVCPELPCVKHRKPLEQPVSKQTASHIITGMHWLRITSSLCTLSLAPEFINKTSTNRMNNTRNSS